MMTSKENHCPKCNGLMERGFMLDRTLHPIIDETFPRWVEGEPAPGSSEPRSVIGKKTRRIERAERCTECGYLELYTSNEIVYG